MRKINLEHWVFIICFIIIGLGCHTVKVKYAQIQAKKNPPVQSNLIKPVKTNSTEAYILRFKKVAQDEQKKYGIPASITLAQGILESNRGKSKLAAHHNNHFGIKCWCRGKKKDCVNMADDSPRDRFKEYTTAWQSYRHHSEFVANMPLKVNKKSNYRDWAKALKRAGYATKSSYAQDLIAIIEKYELYQYDI